MYQFGLWHGSHNHIRLGASLCLFHQMHIICVHYWTFCYNWIKFCVNLPQNRGNNKGLWELFTHQFCISSWLTLKSHEPGGNFDKSRAHLKTCYLYFFTQTGTEMFTYWSYVLASHSQQNPTNWGLLLRKSRAWLRTWYFFPFFCEILWWR